ncbi:14082_t:CDS:1, partial [Funneliformis mosseae]
DYEINNDDDNKLTDSLELISELTFNSWNEFRSWINRFALKEDFNYKIRTSEKVKDVIQKAAYEYAKSGSYTS